MAPMSDAFFQPTFLKSPTGATLRVFSAEVEGAARGVVLIQHGMAEHAARYAATARAMVRHGFHVYVHDHRGHGETSAPDAPLGRFATAAGWRDVIADAMFVRDHARSAHPDCPKILLGHSMGGLIAWNILISHPDAFDAVAVWNADFKASKMAFAGKALLAAERALKGSDVPSDMLPRLTFRTWAKTVEDRRTEFDWLSHDRSVVDAYVADPLCGFEPTVSLWQDVFAMIERGALTANWRYISRHLPIHLMGGGEDPATAGGANVVWFGDQLTNAGFRDVSVTVEDEFRHETLNEIGAERPIANFAAWIERAVIR